MLCDYIPSVLDSYPNLFSCLKNRHSVHPEQPVAPKHSEFFEVSSRRRLRIIHLKPEKSNVQLRRDHNVSHRRRGDMSQTSSGEYWFTCWNRPVQTDKCNCSFRKSQRASKNDNILVPVDINKASYDDNNTDLFNKNIKIESYVEKIITNALVIAYQEYLKKYLKNSVASSIPDLNRDKKSNGIATKSCSKTNTQKPTVLLLHGLGSSAEVWWHVLQCLVNAGHEVLAPDMLGHGYSSVPRSSSAYTFKNLLKDILSVFDKYIGSNDLKKCIVIGHSFGCSLAGALARYRAQQIVQLVLISGGGPTPLAPLVSNNEMFLFNCLQILIKPLLFCGIKRTMFFSSRGKHFEVCDIDNSVPSHVLQYISEGQYWPEGDAAFHRRILIPTLLVHGLQDTHVTLVQECEMERTIPRSFLEIIPTAGHMAMLETPNQLCHMLLCFINWWNK